MRRALQLATIAPLLFAAMTARAQITDPNALVAPPPRTPAQRAATVGQPTDLQWLNTYVGNKPSLLADTRFRELLGDDLRAPQSMWGIGMPLADAAEDFLAGPGSVAVLNNRYTTVNGCVIDPDTHACSSRGLLWIDAAQHTPLVVFTAMRWTETSKTPTQPGAPFNLWLFPSRTLDAAHLSSQLTAAINRFTASCPAPTIANVLLVDPTGIPHIVSMLAAGIEPPACLAAPASAQGVTP